MPSLIVSLAAASGLGILIPMLRIARRARRTGAPLVLIRSMYGAGLGVGLIPAILAWVLASPSALDDTLLLASVFLGYPFMAYGFFKVAGEASIWKRIDLPLGLSAGLAVLIWGAGFGRTVPLAVLSALPILAFLHRWIGSKLDLPREPPLVWERADSSSLPRGS